MGTETTDDLSTSSIEADFKVDLEQYLQVSSWTPLRIMHSYGAYWSLHMTFFPLHAQVGSGGTAFKDALTYSTEVQTSFSDYETDWLM